MADLHICGTCKMQFNNIESFINHKKQCVNNPVITTENEMIVQHNEETLVTQDGTVLEACKTSIDPILGTEHGKSSLVTEAAKIAEVSTYVDDQDISDPVSAHHVQMQEESDPSVTAMDSNTQYITAEELQNLSFSTTPQVAGQVSVHQTDAATYQTGEQSQGLTAVPVTVTMAPVQQTHSDSQNWSTPFVHKVVMIVPANNTVSTGQPSNALEGTSTALSTEPASPPKPPVPRKKYECRFRECSYSTVHNKDLERHHLTHTGDKPHMCSECSRSFSRLDKLKVHMRTHSGHKPYKCNLCSYATIDNSSLKAHQRVHNDERPYKCQICQYASRNSSQLTVHLRTHTGDAPFVCYICDAKFKVNSDLRRHIRCHTGEKPYHCPHCDYKCAIKGNLTKHIDINHSERNSMKCPDCDFVTSSSRMFRDHKKKHITGAAFKCVICNHVATSKTSLKVHLGVHTDEKPHKCSFCNFATRQRGNIRLHVQRKHPEKWRIWWEKSDSKGKGKKNKTKSLSYLSAASLLVEAAAQAADTTSPKKLDRLKATCQKPFVCDICRASFVREDSLRAHTKHHQKMKEAEIREGAALAVLQLKNPVNSTNITSVPVSTVVENIATDVTVNTTTEVTAAPVPTGSQMIIETTQVTPPAARPHVAPHSGHRHGKARSRSSGHMNRVTSQSVNMMAIMQNNENRAVEDNMQNMAISMRRQRRSASSRPSATRTAPQSHVSVIQANPVPPGTLNNSMQVTQSYASQAISTATQIQAQTVQSVIPAQVISSPPVQPQQVAVPAVATRPAFMVSPSGLVRVVSEGATHQQVKHQQTQQLTEGQRNVQVVVSENRGVTVHVLGQPGHVVQQLPQGHLIARQPQALSQVHTQQGNVMTSIQSPQVIQEVPIQQTVISRPALPTSQPASTVLFSQSSPNVIVNPQTQIVSQNQASDSQSHLVTAIINQHLHLVDQRQIVPQGQGQIQTSQGDLMTQQGQVISQGQMLVSQGQTVMAVPNLVQSHTAGQVVQGQLVQSQSVQTVNQGTMVTEGQQVSAQSHQSHVILQVVTGETNADGTPQMKTIQVPIGILQGLLSNSRKDKDETTRSSQQPQQAQDGTPATQPNRN